MYKFNVIPFLCIFGIFYLVETQETETLYEATVKEKYAAQSLSKIQPDEALPMVLIKPERFNLRVPDELEKVTLVDGKMVNGTEFIYETELEQMFFCPEENTNKKCLSQKTFNGNERLQCASEATPDMYWDLIKSRDHEIGSNYSCVYRICERDAHQFNTKKISLYRINYNRKLQKTLYTLHEIKSPKLLGAKLLLREREVDYRIMRRDEFAEFTGGVSNNLTGDERSASSDSTTKPGYKSQKLVPSEDMALALWRKTTFQETNIALQHEQLITLWDKIAKYIRSNAIKTFIKSSTRTVIFTGVFDINSAHKDNNDDQLSNIWVKLVLTSESLIDYNDISDATHGVAILMNNFLGTETNDNSKAIEGYCDQDLCIEPLSNEFKHINGRVRCCAVNEKIMDLFYERHLKLKELHIPNVNVSENQEKLKGDLNITDDLAATSISGIEPNELGQTISK